RRCQQTVVGAGRTVTRGQDAPPGRSRRWPSAAAIGTIDRMTLPYPRDLRGYGRNPPHAQWPGHARVAVQFVLNYEEGGENNPLHGDPTSETFLSELVTAQAYENRHMTMESMYEYGSRAGVWRILREFDARKLPLTVFGVAMALERYPELVGEFMRRDHEIACHGL